MCYYCDLHNLTYQSLLSVIFLSLGTSIAYRYDVKELSCQILMKDLNIYILKLGCYLRRKKRLNQLEKIPNRRNYRKLHHIKPKLYLHYTQCVPYSTPIGFRTLCIKPVQGPLTMSTRSQTKERELQNLLQ